MTEMARTARRLGDPRSTRSLAVWAGLLVPPLAWGTQLVVGDMLFELGCAPGVEGTELAGLTLGTWAVLMTAAVAAATVAAGLAAAAAWRRLRRASDGVSLGRARALAGIGAAQSVLYLAMILFGVFPPLLFEPCSRLL